MKVILAGPPRSGKSCLREGLKKAIMGIPGAPYPYVITACPDGEGAWFQETAERDPDQARKLKERYKELLEGFSPEFVKRVADSVANCTLPLTLVDIGGIPSVENEAICASATHAILLAGDSPDKSWSERLEEWHAFCEKVGPVTFTTDDGVEHTYVKDRQQVVAVIYSDYHGTEDTVEGVGPDGIFRGSVHYLERGEDLRSRPCVVALAEHLVRLATSDEPSN